MDLKLNYLELITLLSKMKYRYLEDKDIVILKFDHKPYAPTDVQEETLVNGNVKIRYLSEKEPLAIVISNFKETIKSPEIKELLGDIPPELVGEVKTMFGGGKA